MRKWYTSMMKAHHVLWESAIDAGDHNEAKIEMSHYEDYESLLNLIKD